jgi:hypothetical protein
MIDTNATKVPKAPAIAMFARWGRFILFLCTAGWLFPHTCTEGMDLSKIQGGHLANTS